MLSDINSNLTETSVKKYTTRVVLNDLAWVTSGTGMRYAPIDDLPNPRKELLSVSIGHWYFFSETVIPYISSNTIGVMTTASTFIDNAQMDVILIYR